MKLQKTFKESYMKTLRDKVITGENVPLYSGETFDLDQTQIKSLANIYEPEGLIDKLNPTREGDLQTAVALFEAYPTLTPLVASNESFWAYLTHTLLFNYTQERWPEVYEDDVDPKYILDHWFVSGSNVFRNAASNLWWSVYNTIDIEREDPYALTKILFSNQTLRVRTFGTYKLIRHREAMLGILGFMYDNPEVMKNNLESRGNFISKYFNMLGSVKQLSYMDKDFFYKVCMDKKDIILSIVNSNDDNNEELYREEF